MSETKPKIRYSVSGCAAHNRFIPLMPPHWEDCSPNFKLTGTTTATSERNSEEGQEISFVWENAPRKETKSYRDNLKAYSHLPNGTAILDSKWVLARLFEKQGLDNNCDEEDEAFPLLAHLESHCFRGPDGYQKFCDTILTSEEPKAIDPTDNNHSEMSFPDLLVNGGKCPTQVPSDPSSLWVVKDAFSNGAGGIWVVDKTSASLLQSTHNEGPLYDDHRYVAQRYAWPPVLYGGRKCHVRVYGLITADGRAYIHKRAFLHVANDTFSYQDNNNNNDNSSSNGKRFEDSVHITNCCANSHDDSKFAGEILADLEATEFSVEKETGQTIVPLGPFFTSMKSSLAALTKRASPFISGGQRNGGLEYLGMDFILSYKEFPNSVEPQPVAYLLEVNAPPSQDTATGLKHAEDLHNDVIRDILTLWVFPKVAGDAPKPGGWRLAYEALVDDEGEEEYILPSKAAIINKIRWGIHERKTTSKDPTSDPVSPTSVKNAEITEPPRYVTPRKKEASVSELIQKFARDRFPFFQSTDSVVHDATEKANGEDQVFFENAGGSQVPEHVIDEMCASLRHRNRSINGSKAKKSARDVFGKILGAGSDDYSVFLGANATSLLSNLANKYAELGLLREGDEVVLSTENHLANVSPWLEAASRVGALVKWWTPIGSHRAASRDFVASSKLCDIVTPRTRIVAISHASNILGQVRDLSGVRSLVDSMTQGYAHLVVDGVAAAPHVFASVSANQPDWYVVSCHKLFGPHLGALCGRRRSSLEQLCRSAGILDVCGDETYKLLEMGTINYEGCSGVVGLGHYFSDLAAFRIEEVSTDTLTQQPFQSPKEGPQDACCQGRNKKAWPLLTISAVQEAYRRVRASEEELTSSLLEWLQNCNRVRVIETSPDDLDCVARLPVVSFVHATIKPSTIVDACFSHGMACRHGTFLSNEHLLREFGVMESEGVVRLSLAHYNTCREIELVKSVLETIPGWF